MGTRETGLCRIDSNGSAVAFHLEALSARFEYQADIQHDFLNDRFGEILVIQLLTLDNWTGLGRFEPFVMYRIRCCHYDEIYFKSNMTFACYRIKSTNPSKYTSSNKINVAWSGWHTPKVAKYLCTLNSLVPTLCSFSGYRTRGERSEQALPTPSHDIEYPNKLPPSVLSYKGTARIARYQGLFKVESRYLREQPRW